MAVLASDSVEAKEIDRALRDWRQGDVALEERWFVHVGDPARPLTDASDEADVNDIQALTSEAEGLAVITQTCDVVRSCSERPYVEVAPLMRVDEDVLHDIRRGRRPKFAWLPALVGHNLVVDLDRVMTVEKSIVAGWKRTSGYTSDAEGRAFAHALARKRDRPAFPDDFTLLADRLRSRLTDKHEKNTDEGRGLRGLREIRVQASPEWEATEVSLFFWFVRNDGDADFEGKSWAELLDGWLKLVPASGRFIRVDGQVVALEEMTGAEYVASDRLDLDHLSARR